MFERCRRRLGGNLDIFAGIAAAGAFSAFLSVFLIFEAADEAASATTARQTAVVAATGKGDKLCGRGDRAAYDVTCGDRIMARSGRNVSVRVVGTNTSVAERGMTDNERIREAFETLDAAARTRSAELAAGMSRREVPRGPGHPTGSRHAVAGGDDSATPNRLVRSTPHGRGGTPSFWAAWITAEGR